MLVLWLAISIADELYSSRPPSVKFFPSDVVYPAIEPLFREPPPLQN